LIQTHNHNHKKINIIRRVIQKVDNWPVYFLDKILGLPFAYTLSVNKILFKIRPNSPDRWIVTENLILDDYQLSNLLIKPKIIVDIGANIGAFTIYALKKYPTAKVIAYEPRRDNYSQMKKNISTNHLQERVITVNAAVTSRNTKTVKLFLNNDHGVSSTTINNGDCVLVKNINFSKIIKVINKSSNNLLKIDIEGGEHELIKTKYKKTLKHFNLVLLEHHYVDTKKNLNTLVSHLREMNMKYEIHDNFVHIYPNETIRRKNYINTQCQ
jgi:FkbM family methyltransferase